MPKKNSKRDFLIFKHETLKQELDDCKSIMAEATQQLYTLYYEKHKQNKKTVRQEKKRCSKERFVNLEKPSEAEAPKIIDPALKSLFRKIAIKSHPDKLVGLSQEEISKKRELYQKAAAAFEEGDLPTLSEIANKLGLDRPIFTSANFKEIENKIKSLKKKIDEIQSTMIWHWYFTENTDLKSNILEKLFEFINDKQNIDNPGA